jgi:hypothetical protein
LSASERHERELDTSQIGRQSRIARSTFADAKIIRASFAATAWFKNFPIFLGEIGQQNRKSAGYARALFVTILCNAKILRDARRLASLADLLRCKFVNTVMHNRGAIFFRAGSLLSKPAPAHSKCLRFASAEPVF